MNLVWMGRQLRRNFLELNELPLSDEQLAQHVLNLYPALYDALSTTARRIKEISDRPKQSTAWFEGTRIERAKKYIENDLAEARALHEMDLMIKASVQGVPASALHDIAIDNNRSRLKVQEDIELDNASLDAALRLHLQNHELIDKLHRELNDLIDMYDSETHATKRKALIPNPT